jgi:hypothetical protein
MDRRSVLKSFLATAYPGSLAGRPKRADFTRVKASQLNTSLDCDLNTGLKIGGGGPATDNTAALNSFLAQGTATNPVILEMDGASLVTGLFLPALGHASIVGNGWDTGFYVKSGSNQDCIHNGNATAAIPSDPITIGQKLPSASTRGLNVMLKDFRINGNRGNGTTGNSNSGDPHGNKLTPVTWYFGINLMNLANIEIDNVWIYDVATYNIRLSNCGHVTVRACRFEAPSLQANTDGVHLNGGCNDIIVDSCYGSINDDFLAVNCPEGYGGSISRVVMSNCLIAQAASIARVYTGSAGLIADGILVSNCRSSNSAYGFILGVNGAAGSVDSIANFSAVNCVINGGYSFAIVSQYCGLLNFEKCIVVAPNQTRAFLAITGWCTSSITLTDCKIYRNASGKAAMFMLSGSAAIGTLTINGFSIEATAGSAYPPVANASTYSGTCTNLVINAFNPTNITAFSASLAPFTNVMGPGVMATGYQWVNSQMMNGVNYLSTTSGLPSTKIAGTVKTYTVI